MSDATIAVLGGTGKEGGGLASRWARAGVPVIIGSRSPERAAQSAEALAERLGLAPQESIRGIGNADAARAADIIVSAMPADGQLELVAEIPEIIRPKLFVTAAIIWPPSPERSISSAEQAKEVLGPDSRVAAAFQTVSAASLSGPTRDEDTLIIADCEQTGTLAAQWVSKTGIRGVVASTQLADARTLEAMTGILLKVNKRYRMKSSGLRITGLSLSPDP